MKYERKTQFVFMYNMIIACPIADPGRGTEKRPGTGFPNCPGDSAFSRAGKQLQHRGSGP